MITISQIIGYLKTPSKMVAGATFIFTSILLFGENKYLSKLYLLDFKKQNIEAIGIFFLLSFSILTFFFLCWAANFIKDLFIKIHAGNKISKNMNEIMNALSTNQKRLIKNMYQNNNQISVPMTDGDAIYLSKNGIIRPLAIDLNNMHVAVPHLIYNLNTIIVRYIKRNPQYLWGTD